MSRLGHAGVGEDDVNSYVLDIIRFKHLDFILF